MVRQRNKAAPTVAADHDCLPSQAPDGDACLSRLVGEMTDHALDAALLVDSAGIVRYANPAFFALSGYDTGLVGTTMNQILPAQKYIDDGADDHFR